MAEHPIGEEHLKHHIGILGKTRSGKSVTAKGFVESLVKSGKHVCVIDPCGDWYGLRAAGQGAGLEVLILGGEHGDVAIDPDMGTQVATAVHETRVPVVVDISSWVKSEQVRFMLAFSDEIYRLRGKERGPIHLVIDEADQFIPQSVREGGDAPKLYNRMNILVRLGGKRGFRITMITQRPATIAKDVLTQVETLVCMRLTGPQDQKAVTEWFTNVVSQAEAKRIAKSLAKLPTGTGYIYSTVDDELNKVKFPMCQTYDAGKSPDEYEEAVELASVDLTADVFAEMLKREQEPSPGEHSEDYVNELRATNQNLAHQLQSAKADLAETNQRLDEIDALCKQTLNDLYDIFNIAGMAVRRSPPSSLENVEIVGANSIPPGYMKLLEDHVDDNGDIKLTFDNQEELNTPTVTAEPQEKLDGDQLRAMIGDLPKGEEAMLRALIQFPAGLKRQQLGALTGYTKKSTRDSYILRLRDKGLADADRTRVFVTDAGKAYMPDAQPLPTGRELQQYWFQRLPKGEAEMLGLLIAAYPEAMSKQELSDLSGYEKKSTRDSYLQRLATKELIINERGSATAAEILF